MDNIKNQLAERLKTSNTILVTVSRNPSVDQLSALLGLTLALNKMGKHAAAVFSGEIPPTLEFLQPEATIEKNTDSLQDFIIALDKSKADKLRYKVEDDVVRIFITPYKSSISQDDLQFSEGDFNVEVVVALGVHQQEDLDDAITKHGRILHDATVSSINTSIDGGLGSLNWHDNQASSLSELVTELIQAMEPSILDNQIATALLTGIVSETERFSNDKTTSLTMSAGSALMSAGANQQLVASKLQEELAPEPNIQQASNEPESDEPKQTANAEGMLEIEHVDGEEGPDQQNELGGQTETYNEQGVQDAPNIEQEPHNETESNQNYNEQIGPAKEEGVDNDIQGNTLNKSKLAIDAPSMGGTFTANARPEETMLSPSTDPLSAPTDSNQRIMNRPVGDDKLGPAPQGWVPPKSDKKPIDRTLTDLEHAVNSPHLHQQPDMNLARQQVDSVVDNGSVANNPIQSLNAQPMGGDLHGPAPEAEQPMQSNAQPLPPGDPNAPPPVPPPIPFQFNGVDQQQ